MCTVHERGAILFSGLVLVAIGYGAACSPHEAAARDSAGGGLVKLGGCQTTAEEYGAPALADSLALQAIEELMAPGPGPRTGPACAQLGAEAVLFVQIGAVERRAEGPWVALASQVTQRMEEAGLSVASRTLLLHTTGPCFPPYHVDLRAVGSAGTVEALLKTLPQHTWAGFDRTAVRGDRTHFVTAGRSLQESEIAVDLVAR